jgi:small lipoprotein (TIGR04452 family)
MKIKRILFTGVSVLAISLLSNCFLTSWLGDALDPYGSVRGDKVTEIIQKAASDGYGFAGITYTQTKTKSEVALLTLSNGTQGVDNEAVPGFGQRQTAFVQQVAKMASSIDPNQTYTAQSVKDCAAAVQASSFAVAHNQIERADTRTAGCIDSTKTFADKKLSEVMRGSCMEFAASTGTYTALATGAGAHLTSTGVTCQACMILAINVSAGETAGTGTGNTYYGTSVAGHTGTNGDAATNTIIPWMDQMKTLFGQVVDSSVGNTMEQSKDSCMELYMAAVAAGASLAKCAKIEGAGGITRATTLTGFVGGTACDLKPTGHLVSTPFGDL